MNEQLPLFEMPEPGRFSYNLVLAIFPDHTTARQISDLGNSLRRTHGLNGRVRPTTHLHVSLPFPRRDGHAPEALVRHFNGVCKVVAAATRPFKISFDHVGSFRGRPENRPLVLRSDGQGGDGVRKLHESLRVEFAKPQGTASSASRFTPHLTLLYDRKEIAAEPVAQVGWTVKEMILVLSEVGRTKYHQVGRWEFGG